MRDISIHLIKHDPYLYIDSNNNLQLFVPVTNGDSIGLDNTCKSGVNTAEFFKQKGALKSLQQFELYCLIKYNQKNSFNDATKYQKWYWQIDSYKILLKRLCDETAVTQTSQHPEYPPAVINALRQPRQNAKAILLSPPARDNYLRFRHYQCSLERTDETTFSSKLKSALTCIDYSQSPQAQHATVAKVKNTTMDYITQQIPLNQDGTITTSFDYVDFMLNLLIMSIQHHTEEIMPLKRSTQDTRTILAWSGETTVTISEAVNCLLSSLEIEYIFWMRHSNPLQHLIARLSEKELSKSEHNKCTEQLNIVLQFYIGLINIYCYENKMIHVTTDFGKIIESDNTLSDALVSIIKISILHSDNTEAAIINFLNNYKRQFKLNHHISQNDASTISTRFIRDYISISNAPHFDEFLFFMPQHFGNFITYRGRICLTLDYFTYYQSEHLYHEIYVNEGYLPNYLAVAEGQQTRQLKPQLFEPLQLSYDDFRLAIYLIQIHFDNSLEIFEYFLGQMNPEYYSHCIPHAIAIIDLIIESSDQLLSLLSTLSEPQRQEIFPLLSVIFQKHIITVNTISQFNKKFPTQINTILDSLKDYLPSIVKGLNDLRSLLATLTVEQIHFLLTHINIHTFIDRACTLATILDVLPKEKQRLVLNAIGDLNRYIMNQTDLEVIEKHLPQDSYHHFDFFRQPNKHKRTSHQAEFNDNAVEYQKRSYNSSMI